MVPVFLHCELHPAVRYTCSRETGRVDPWTMRLMGINGVDKEERVRRKQPTCVRYRSRGVQ
eukprot:313397-Prorocentrum_lima.AAC.1